jgi:PAS domain S-box-containing protein
MDLLSLILQLAFFGVFGATLWRFLRRPGWLELAVVAVFATTALTFGIAFLEPFAPTLPETLRPVSTTALLAQPFLVVLLASIVSPVPRWAPMVAFVGFVASSLLMLLTPDRPVPVLLFAVGYFVVVESAAAVGLAMESQRRYGLPRVRIALAAAATALFGIAILIGGVALAAAGGTEAPESAQILSRLAALAAALGYLAAFLPPLWLRRLAQRAVAFDVTHALVAAPTGTQAGVLWRQLALAAREILGADRVAVYDTAGRPLTDDIADRGEIGDAADIRRPDRAADRTVEVPLLTEGSRVGKLVAHLDGRPLFVEDDIVLLELLGSSTARTVQREDAVARLSDARAALDASAAVRASEARFRALLEAHPNAILAIDSKGTVTWSTGTAAELFGFVREELVGMPLSELVQLEGAGVDRTPPDTDTVWRAETTATRADGETFPVEVALSNFEAEGQTFDLAVVADITWRHAADQVRDRFLGILSHELRTPITSIFGGSQLLLSRGERLTPEDRRELVGDVAAEAERLQRIVENLLVLARVERGAEFGGSRPVLLNRALADLLQRERTLWPQVTINLDIPEEVPIVAADDEYLAQVMRNLLSNAAKYAGVGATIDVSVAVNGTSEVAILVRDNGPGIVAAEADELFRLYFRSPDTAATPGAGIGLFVCRQLVLAMGGRIWARSRPEGGAEFGLTLPVYEDENQSARPGWGSGAHAPASATFAPAHDGPAG